MSPGPVQRSLAAAYLATTYRVFLPAGPVELRIGEPNLGLDAFLYTEGEAVWVYMSAMNPASRQMMADENAERHRELGLALRNGGFRHFPGEAVADAGNWPLELGFLVMGLEQDQARHWGLWFCQNAVVWGALGDAPRLLWCR